VFSPAGRVSATTYDCVIVAEDQCARRHAFPVGARIYIKVRLSQSPTGWLHGRISNPTISIQPTGSSSTAVEIGIAAATVSVPIVAKSSEWSALPATLKEAYRATGGFNGAPSGSRLHNHNSADPELRNSITAPTPYSTTGMSELLAWLPHINDTATANISLWAVRSLSAYELSGTSSCFSNNSQLNGLVMTNATTYSAGPPTFDKANGSLDYKVAAPHYTSGGHVFLGTYDLIMRSDVARCIYGFSKAPLNASISVVDNDGVTTVATKLVSEKDGWLRIAAYGFDFSSPTIRVKLTQASETAKPKTTAKSGTAKQKKITISCKKGKTVKKVSGTSPKCPAGYKKMKT